MSRDTSTGSGSEQEKAPGFSAHLSEEIRNAFARLAGLQQRVDAQFAADTQWVSEALVELDCAQEELHTAEEELHARADELSMAHAALQLERRRYQDLFDAAPDAYIVTDLKGIVEDSNRRACELLNIAAPFLNGKPLVLFVTEEDRPSMRSRLNALIRERSATTLELRLCPRHAPEPIRCSITASRAVGVHGEAQGLRWLLREVMPAEPQAATQAPSDAAQGQLAGGQTAALEREAHALRRRLERETNARARAERALLERDRVLVSVAHELRNPLTVIANWSHVLASASGTSVMRERASSVVHRNVTSLARLIEDLLDNARSELGSLRVDLAPVDLAQLVKGVVDDHLPAAEQASITLSYASHVAAVRVLVDGVRIQQVLGNLLRNALKFTPARGAISVELACEPSALQVSVRDTGRGIPEAQLERVFLPFVQADARRDGHRGLGLGLSIARRLIELHDGSLTAESAGEGQGARFVLRLPRNDAH